PWKFKIVRISYPIHLTGWIPHQPDIETSLIIGFTSFSKTLVIKRIIIFFIIAVQHNDRNIMRNAIDQSINRCEAPLKTMRCFTKKIEPVDRILIINTSIKQLIPLKAKFIIQALIGHKFFSKMRLMYICTYFQVLDLILYI